MTAAESLDIQLLVSAGSWKVRLPILFFGTNETTEVKSSGRRMSTYKSKHNPGVLQRHLIGERDSVEANCETEYMSNKIDNGAKLRCLRSVTLCESS